MGIIGTLLRAAFGFGVAFYVLHPRESTVWLQTHLPPPASWHGPCDVPLRGNDRRSMNPPEPPNAWEHWAESVKAIVVTPACAKPESRNLKQRYRPHSASL